MYIVIILCTMAVLNLNLCVVIVFKTVTNVIYNALHAKENTSKPGIATERSVQSVNTQERGFDHRRRRLEYWTCKAYSRVELEEWGGRGMIEA
jgi:hypothetical protein